MIARFCKIVVKDAVNIENIVIPTKIHIIANKRARIDLGDLSPYLKIQLSVNVCFICPLTTANIKLIMNVF